MPIDKEVIKELQSRLSKADIEYVFEKLLFSFKDEIFNKELIILSGRYESLCREDCKGTITFSEKNTERNQILSSIADILENLNRSLDQKNYEVPTESATPTEDEGVKITPSDDFEDFSYDVVIQKYNLSPLPFEKPNVELDRRIKKTTIPDLLEPAQVRLTKFDWVAELEQFHYIALLGDAGMGKTYELKRVCHELKETGHFIPVFETVRNNEYLVDVPALPKILEKKIVLVLDGLDESDINISVNNIKNFQYRFPTSKIIVSCRSNAYSEGILSGFDILYLQKLDGTAIQGYVEKKLGRSEGNNFFKKWGKLNHLNPNQLIDNPFFLVCICDFVKRKNNEIPLLVGEVFEFMIDTDLSRSIEKEEQVVFISCRKTLEKIAFIMECRGESFMSKQELEKMISEKEREILLEKSTLVELRDDVYQFFHNNLQEYLAAKVLSRTSNFSHIKNVIAAKPDYNRLKWSWVNTLSFLIGIWDKDNSLKWQLFHWLMESDLDALIKIASFEKEKVPKTYREDIFKLAFQQCKRDDSIVGFHLYQYWDLAAFGESPEIVNYLFEELRDAQTPTVKCNALVLLKSMKTYFVLPETRPMLRQELLSNIYDFEKNTSTVRQLAIQALIELFEDIDKMEVEKMVKTFFDSEDAGERTAIYQLIEKQNLQIDLMEKLVLRSIQLDDYEWREGEVRLANEDWQIDQCFENIKGEKALVSFFEKYAVIAQDNNDWSSNQNFFSRMLGKLTNTNISPEGAKVIFEAMKGHFANYFWYPSYSGKISIVQFVEKNHLQQPFVQLCMENIEYIAVPAQFLNEEIIEYLVQAFGAGKIERKKLESYIFGAASYKDLPIADLVQKLNVISDEPFNLPEIKPPIDHAEIEKRKRLTEKSIYFNKEKFITTISEVFEKHGKLLLKKGEIYSIHRDLMQEGGVDVFEHYPHSLLWFIDDHFGISKEELIEQVEKNWDWISISQIKKFLSREKSIIGKQQENELNDEELAYVKTWCERHVSAKDITQKVTHGDIAFVWLMIYCKFTHYPEYIYEQMINSTVQNYLNVNVLEFLENSGALSFEKIKKAVLKFLANEDNKGYGVYQCLRFVEKYKIEDAIHMLPRFIETKNEQFDNRDTALQIYIALGGNRTYLLKLLEDHIPEQNDYREQRLLNYFSAEPKEDFEKLLLKKILELPTGERQVIFAHNLLRCGNLFGLHFLVNYTEKEKKSPFAYRIDNTGYRIENPLAIPLLLRLFDFAYDKSISQDAFDRVSNFARQTLQHLANCQDGKYFWLVIHSLKEHLKINRWVNELGHLNIEWLTTANLDGLKEIQYFTKDLEFQYFQKQEMPTEEAVKLFDKLSFGPRL